MNSIIKTAAKITEELSQPNEKSDARQDGVQHTKARLGESLKKKWNNKEMHGQYCYIYLTHLITVLYLQVLLTIYVFPLDRY